MKPKHILFIYLLISLANLVSSIIPSEELNQFTKPLLMPLLILYVYQSSIGKTTARILLIGVALLFSWLGDVVLMYQSDQIYFIVGIGLFLIAQTTYILIFRKSMYQKPAFSILKVLPYGVYAAVLFYVLLPAGELTLPITIYGLVIMTMAIMANLREGNTSQESYKVVFWGSLLFVLSDSILAINAFHTSIPFAGVFIMSTYCAAQLLIVIGLLKHQE